MTQTSDLLDAIKPVTALQIEAALLDMAGDLGKAQVLQDTLAPWLVQAKSQTLRRLQQAHADSEDARRRAQACLDRLQPLDRFCVQQLQAYLQRNGVEGLDVERDTLELPKRTLSGVGPDLGGALQASVTVQTQSLVQAAMQNFSADQARPGGMSASAMIRSAATGKAAEGISVEQFVGYCRDLDLGEAYQEHVCDLFGVSQPQASTAADNLSFNRAALDIGQARCLEMQIDLHIASAKGHIRDATYDWLLNVIKLDQPADASGAQMPTGETWGWQGLNIDGACVWSVLLLSTDAAGELPAGGCLVYMPNEPVRPWFEYASLEDFKQYLTLKLQVPSYRRFFECYLDESERLDFFKAFTQRRSLGALEVIPVKRRFSEFFFHAYVGKVRLDAQVLAVPCAQVDVDASRTLLQDYLDIGLNLLNAAGLVVPVLGQLMMGVAIGQLLGEVFEGVQDWSHHDHSEALRHLINVAESIAGMVLFAAGGKVVGTLKRQWAESSRFFDKVEPITRADQTLRLWRPRLTPYRQPTEVFQAHWVANPRGLYQASGGTYVNIDGNLYRITFDTALGQWRVNHPTRPEAWQPPLLHNRQGGWQHVFERPHSWNSPLYNLGRIDPALIALRSDQLNSLAVVTEMDLPDLQYLATEHEPLPERFQDCVARYKQHQQINDLIYALEHQEPPHPSTARAQMLALPLLPGWPQGRFFELLDDEGYLLESHPDLTPFDYEDLSIHITERQLKKGEVMLPLLRALSPDERAALLGERVGMDEAQALLERRLLSTLKSQHLAVYRRLYQDYEGVAQGELIPLVARYRQLPRRVAWELLTKASTADRASLRNTGRVPLRLAEQTRQVLDQLQQDQALMGLYWPPLANDATHRVILGLLERLYGWPQDLLVQLREGSISGRVLAQVGPEGAGVQRSIVQSDQGFQVFEADGKDRNTLVSGPDALYQAVVDCLTNPQRVKMGLMGDQAPARLRSQIRFKSQDERYRVPGYVWPERGMPLESTAWCAQAQLGATVEHPASLVRKVKKLYPRMSAEHVSALLEEAGTDHLSRAKAVQSLEVQFTALHRVLKAWRNEKVPSGPLATALWDQQLSRHKAMHAIEHCWRRMTLAADERGVQVPSLELDGHLLGRLPLLPAQVRFEHVQRLSLRGMQLGDDAAYLLKHFPGLRSLNLADNHLTRLPQALGLMLQLEYLYLANNRLLLTEYTRGKLAAMDSLRLLNLSENPLLDPPDVSKMFNLRELFLRDCQLKEFPDSCRHLPRLEHLDLRQNEIQRLPDWLFGMPRRYTEAVNLRHNPLSPASRLALRTYRRNFGIGMGYIEDDLARLNEQRARELWMPHEHDAGFAEKNLLWQSLKDEPGSDGLFKLLAELGNTADAQFVREDLDRRVWRVLENTAAEADLREDVFQRAATPLGCDDAAATSFSALEILVEINDATRLAEGRTLGAKALLKLGRGLFRLDQLESIARRHSDDNPTADPLEVSLAYRTGLVDRFHLPGQPSHMRFARLGGVTQGALDSAEAQLKSAELSSGLLDYLVELPFWTDYLKRTFASRFATLNIPFDQRVSAVFDQSLTLDDSDYRDQMNQILQEQEQAQRAQIRSLTEDALRIDELGICARPMG